MTFASYFQTFVTEMQDNLLWPYSSMYHSFFIPLIIAVLSLMDFRHPKKSRLKIIGTVAAYSCCGLLLFCLVSPFFSTFMGEEIAGHVVLLLLILIYSIFFSNLSPTTRIVVGSAIFSEINWMQTIVHMILFFYVNLRVANLLQLLLTLFAYTVIRLFRPPVDDKSPLFYWLIMLLIAAISFFSLIVVRVYESVDYGAGANFMTLHIILPLFAVVSLLIYVMYSLLTHEHRKLEMVTAIQIRQAHDMEQYNRTEALAKELHSMRHELRNHFTAMNIMLREKQYDRLSEYFEEILGQNTMVLDAFYCAHPLVSALISNAITTSSAAGIKLQAVAAVPENLPIADSDLFSLLSNIISNAVEGCQRSGSDTVKLSLHTEKDYLFISATNAVDDDFLLKNPRLLSTKTNKEGHGYGVPIIRKIAEKYNGCATFSVEAGTFSADVMLCLEET